MIEEKEVYIKSLDRKRDITIYLPNDYQKSNKTYPVLIINDGQNAFFDEKSYIKKSWGFLESAQELNLDIIMVAIPCNTEPLKREDEYGPWKISSKEAKKEFDAARAIGGEGKKLAKYIVKELKPYLDNNYPTIKSDYAMVGSSMGALFTFYVTLKYPKIFKKAALLSTPFWVYQKEYLKLLKSANIKDVMIYQDFGGNEGNDDEKESNNYYQSNYLFKDILEDKIDNYYFKYYEDHYHSEYCWCQRVPVFLELFYKKEK